MARRRLGDLMAQYYRVSPNFWKGRRNWSDREKLLAQYLLSCPHRNLEGLYWLPLAYVQADLGWPSRAVEDAVATLERDGFAAYDAEAQVMFVCKALKYQSPSTEKQVIGAVSSLERVPETVLWERFLSACADWAPRLADELAKQPGADPNATRIPFGSHSTGSGNASEPDSDIARTPSSNSSSNSEKAPQPPKGERQRDRVAFETAMTAWVRTHPVSDEMLTAWEPVATRLREAVDEATFALHLDALHLHADGDTATIGVRARQAAWIKARFLRTLEEAAGKPVELVECGCEIPVRAAA
jgi:hypothetical protein